MNTEDVWFVVNPRSAGGRTARRMDELRARVAQRFANATIVTTRAGGDAEARAQEAVRAGARVVVAVGGDGTASEVVNGLRDAPAETVFAVLPAGTGSDLVKTLRMPAAMEAALDVVAGHAAAPIDVIGLTLTQDGRDVTRRCVNVAGFGINGEVVAQVNRSGKRWGGRVTFLTATIAALAAYRAPEVEIRWTGPDGDGEWRGPLSAAFLTNGAFCGGGMWIGRGGRMDDGLVELTIIQERGIARAAAQLPRLYRGTLARADGVIQVPITQVEARSAIAIKVDVDGEQPGILPLRASVLPKALLVRALSLSG